MKTCPVLAYTVEVREWLYWFQRCYSVRAYGLGGVTCERVCWPAAGGAGDQDARLVMALEHMAGVLSRVIAEQVAARAGSGNG